MGWISVHVDDALFSMHPAWLQWFVITLRRRIVFGDIDGDSFAFAGVDHETAFSYVGTPSTPLPLRISESQENYTSFLEELEVSPSRKQDVEAKATPAELRDFRGGLGGVVAGRGDDFPRCGKPDAGVVSLRLAGHHRPGMEADRDADR